MLPGLHHSGGTSRRGIADATTPIGLSATVVLPHEGEPTKKHIVKYNKFSIAFSSMEVF